MGWIYAIDIVVLFTLISVAKRRGLERALPVFAFCLVLIPDDCRIVVPGLFDLYTHRLSLIVLTVLFLTKKNTNTSKILPLKSLLLVHTGWLVLSTLASIVVVTSAKQFVAQVLEYYLIYYIIVKTITNVETISKISFAMVSAIGIACVFGLFESYCQWTILSIFPAELQETYGSGNVLYAELMDRGIRVRSVFPHPILFGGSISMMIPIALYLLTSVGSRFKEVSLYICLVLMFWSIYKTGSRGPWLATAASMTVFFFTANRKVRKQLVKIGALVVVVLLMRPGVKDTIWNTYLATMNTNTQMGMSFAYRPALFNAVTKALNDDPFRALVGFGLGAFRQKGLMLILPNIEPHLWYTCDSAWLLLAYETGYVGAILIAALLFKPALMALRGYKTLPRKRRYFCISCFSAFFSFFIVMISVASYGWGQNGSMLWVTIATMVSYIGLTKREQGQQTVASRSIGEPVAV